MPEVVEFKVSQPGKLWEETPVVYWDTLCFDTACALAQRMANMFEREVRWNYVRCGQGHYIRPEIQL